MIFPTAGRTWKGNKSSTVDIGAWELNFTAEELERIKNDMILTKEAIMDALDRNDPSKLPPCPEWLLTEFEDTEPGEYKESEDEKHPFNFIDLEVINE